MNQRHRPTGDPRSDTSKQGTYFEGIDASEIPDVLHFDHRQRLRWKIKLWWWRVDDVLRFLTGRPL